jgi:hypothetical protein
MKINVHQHVTARLNKREIKIFETWGSAAGVNVSQALKFAILYTIKNKNPNEVLQDIAKEMTIETAY